MNRVITVNLGGNAYPLEEPGYEALRAYLDGAVRRLAANPDRDEILADIERAIAEKFRAVLGAHKSVVLSTEVAAVIADMGPVEDAAEPAAATGPGGAASEAASSEGASGPSSAAGSAPGGTPPKRLYRLREGAMIAGVCNGLGAYLDVDVTVVRLVFVLVCMVTAGAGILAYVILAIVVPPATTPAEKAAVTGFPATAEEYIRRAKAGYYAGLKRFQDREARRAWKRRFRREMRRAADRWQCEWHGFWRRSPRPSVAVAIMAPIASLLVAAIGILWLLALISLIAKHAVFGVAVPAGTPLWLAVLVLLLAYLCVVWPFKVMRHAAWWHDGYGWRRSAPAAAWDGVVWLAVFVTLFWLATHHRPALNEAFHGLMAALHQAADSIRRLWSGH